MLLNHYKLRETLEDQGALFCYSGYVNEGVLSGIGQAIKQKLSMEKIDARTIRDVFSVFVEQVQNVIRYAAEAQPDASPSTNVLSYGTLTVGRDAENFFVSCSNRMARGDVTRLQQQLSMIRELDRESLNKLYKQILKGEVPTGSKGAGVGFVHIARNASKPIEFSFIEINDDYAFFSMKAMI
ncbi:MAG: hypothetical protein HQL78_09565 [Magnetococcales bacterium]|nr:hypothetical protein [Magnetococcales bacterium]